MKKILLLCGNGVQEAGVTLMRELKHFRDIEKFFKREGERCPVECKSFLYVFQHVSIRYSMELAYQRGTR